jgi:NAD(P)-dependent dehydrogenase (short-subunit alcohol dehydrogenase family)
MDVAISYRRDEESARQTAQLIEAVGRRAALFPASIDDYDAAVQMADDVLSEFGHVDAFVHSAGIASRGQTVVDTEMGRRLAKAAMGAGDDIHSLDHRMPFGHVCSPEEVADVVAWVVSDGARYVNDQWIAVDGGTFQG